MEQFFECDRCGAEIPEDIWKAEYANALLCASCNRKCIFDYENPVLHLMALKEPT